VIQSNISDSTLQAPTDSPDLSIIIVSWNVAPLLAQCLSAIVAGGAAGRLNAEIIVVDNASSDGSGDVAATFPGARVIRCKSNLGYGRANNIGFRLARGEHLLVLNPDTVPCAGSIERLVAFQRSHPRGGIVSPRLLNGDGSVQTAAFRFPTLLMAAIDLFPMPELVPGRLRHRLSNSHLNGRYPDEGKRTRPFQIDHPLGACMLLSRRAYEEVGGFDQAIFMYAEEIDLAMRYKASGWECWQVPVAEVIHLGGQSTSQAPDAMQVRLWKSRLYLYRKHYPPAARLGVALLLLTAQVKDAAATVIQLALGRITRAEAQQTLVKAGRLAHVVFGG
jgi:N-acetylglucosaminyl-diphospho-decaprenol L-rhamnosyltransferase